MKKNKENINEELEYTIDDLDKEIEEYFFIDKEKIENIKAPAEMKSWVKEAIEKVEKEKEEESYITKIKEKAKGIQIPFIGRRRSEDIEDNEGYENSKKKLIALVASIAIMLMIGVYNPALAYKIPIIQDTLETINEALYIDEIAEFTGLDKIIPKVVVDEESNKLKFETKSNNQDTGENEVDESVEQNHPSSENDEKEGVDDNQGEETIDIEQPVVNPQNIPTNEGEALQFIHEMSHTIINAEDGAKWGLIDITPKNIDIAIESVVYVENKSDRDYLYRELNEWKKGNLHNGVEVHNYVWRLQGGTIGKAESLIHSEINRIQDTYFD